jgi:hypothetical protein
MSIQTIFPRVFGARDGIGGVESRQKMTRIKASIASLQKKRKKSCILVAHLFVFFNVNNGIA